MRRIAHGPPLGDMLAPFEYGSGKGQPPLPPQSVAAAPAARGPRARPRGAGRQLFSSMSVITPVATAASTKSPLTLTQW